MDSSVSPKDDIWFLRVCHHISTGLYIEQPLGLKDLKWQRGIRRPKLRRLNNYQAQIQAYGYDASTEVTVQRAVRQVRLLIF